jgi:hypothetical protein
LVANDQSAVLANPFRAGNGVAPPFLAGRDALLDEFARFLSEAHPPHVNWALTGLRGTGKTVLLNEFATRAERAGWVCSTRELGDRHRDPELLAEAIASDSDALIRRCNALAGIGQTIERSFRFFRPRRLTLGEFGVEPAYESAGSDPAESIGAALSAVAQAADEAHRPGALLLYDEAHLLTDDRARNEFPLSSLLAGLGEAQRSSQAIRIVLCGLPTLTLNLKRAKTYAERMFRQVVVGHLERGDAWDAIRVPLAGSGRSFALDLVGDIVEATDGYAYFLQFFGSFLCSRIGHSDVDRADYAALAPVLLHELDLAFFEDRYAVAGPAGQQVLEAMARRSGTVGALDLRRALPENANVDAVIGRLVERGLIYRPSRGRYDFALPLFRAYLRRRANLTELAWGR